MTYVNATYVFDFETRANFDGDPVAQIAPYNANNAMTPTTVMRFLTDAEVKVTRIAAYDTVLTPVEVKLLGDPGEIKPTSTVIRLR